ncbi:MAG TPA: hypothetical protein VFA19_15335 [Gaiellaceae bacterium]|nr:hypothetical protein [Gaiellaceae bacterium]
MTVGLTLLVLLAAEGVTILRIGQLLSPHEFIGVLLIPPVALKLSSTGYRFFSYYRHREAYVVKGPPRLFLRMLVAPVLVVSTLVVFGTGVALLWLDRRRGLLVGLHKVAFLVWIGAFGVHVLAYLTRLPSVAAKEWHERTPGRTLRYSLVAATVAVGVLLALGTARQTDGWRDQNLPHQLDFH